MNDPLHDNDDLNIVDAHELYEKLVLDSEEDRRAYLQTRWIEEVLSQLVEARVDSGLTQKDVGERMGKPQSTIARLERGSDMKLSTLWEYLAAVDLTPSGRLQLTSLHEQEKRLSTNGASPGSRQPASLRLVDSFDQGARRRARLK